MKTEQIQIRVSTKEKAVIKQMAASAKMDMSSWVLSKIFPKVQERFQQIVSGLENEKNKSYFFAELNDFLTSLDKSEFIQAVSSPPLKKLSAYLENYLAALIEQAAESKKVSAPEWLREVVPLDEPVFGTDLKSLRLYLLLNSPAAFKKRNIFIDSGFGERI